MRLLAAIAAAFAGIRRTRVAPPALAFALFAALAVIPAENVRAHSDNCTESNHYKPNNLDDPCLRSDQAEFYDWCVDNGGTPDANASGVVTCSNISSETCRAANFFALDFTRCQNPSSNPYFLCRQSNNGNAEYDFASAPHACKCNEGALGNAAEGECAPPSPLAPEIQSASPNLASIVALLDANEDPNGTDGNGNSLLAIAVTLGHLEVMSVLITAGANPSVTIADTGSDLAHQGGMLNGVPHYYAVNNMHTVINAASFAWPRAAELLFAFGNAVDIAEGAHNYTYNWDEVVHTSTGNRAAAYLPRRYNLDALSSTAAEDEAILAMAHYLIKVRNSACNISACDVLSDVCMVNGEAGLEDGNQSCQILWSECGTDSDRDFPNYYREDSGAAVCGCANAGDFQIGQHCARRTEELTDADTTDAELRSACESLGGKPKVADGGLLCEELDASGTFCLLDSREALPCEGLLKHVRDCNYGNRFALNPFLCGRVCDQGNEQYAAGGKCCAADGSCNTPTE